MAFSSLEAGGGLTAVSVRRQREVIVTMLALPETSIS